jgi:hypothetical protein
MQNATKIPFFWPVTLSYPGGDIDKIYILSKLQGLVATKPYPPPFFEKKTTFFPFIYCFFFTFQDENSQKERYERRYKFDFFFLFGNFLLKCEKSNEREKWFFFSKKGRGYRALQLHASVVETQWVEIADWWNRQ